MIEKFIQDTKIKYFVLGEDIKRDISFINSLYSGEDEVIFEQNPFYILSYLSYKNKLYGISSDAFRLILVNGEKETFIFTPNVKNFEPFSLFVNGLKNHVGSSCLRLQNISEKKTKLIESFSPPKEIIQRSKEEAIYDLGTILALRGGYLSGLRSARNKLLLTGKITFHKVNALNIKDALFVLQKWNQYQGLKYKKNKEEKESFMFSRFSKFNETFPTNVFSFNVGYLEDHPVAVCAIQKSLINPKYGIIHLVKGLNSVVSGGAHGVSDATYLYCFNKMRNMEILYANDGDLGSEDGTRNHKLSFRPIRFLKSFDVLI